jgi:AraC-like DNA-binding protein
MMLTQDFSPLRLSSADFPVRDRIEAVCETYGRAIFQLDVAPSADAPFRVDMDLRAMPGLGVATGASSPVACRHRVAASRDDDAILLVLQSGGVSVRQCGRDATLAVGEATLISNAETADIVFHRPSRFMNLRLPIDRLSPLIADVAHMRARPVRRDLEPLRLLADYITMLRQGGGLSARETQRLIAAHVHDLVALTLGATREAARAALGRGVRAARLQAIKADILANLARPDLTAAGMAARHRLSGRYFRKLFAQDGGSFSSFVLAQRLARAHRLLADLRSTGHSIGAIAFAVGFNDLSYFNRAFRRRYGATPSDVRASLSRA